MHRYSLSAHTSCYFRSHRLSSSFSFFFFNDTATTEIYTLSLHDALPISSTTYGPPPTEEREEYSTNRDTGNADERKDRKSTRLNSSHSQISYAVFCLKKKKEKITYDHGYNRPRVRSYD